MYTLAELSGFSCTSILYLLVYRSLRWLLRVYGSRSSKIRLALIFLPCGSDRTPLSIRYHICPETYQNMCPKGCLKGAFLLLRLQKVHGKFSPLPLSSLSVQKFYFCSHSRSLFIKSLVHHWRGVSYLLSVK